jgi:hypothetical protein
MFVLSRIQVLFNSGIATVLAVIIWKLTGWQDKCLDSKDSILITSIIGGIIGHYCCCNGDTWSSEIGVLSDAQPRLITTFKVNTLLLRKIICTCLSNVVAFSVPFFVHIRMCGVPFFRC